MHCNRTFMSDKIWFQRVIGDPQGFEGYWMCPTPNCSGAGFTIDIFPTDPNHPANEGWHYDDDDEEGQEEYDPELDGALDDPMDASSEWDPDEPKWKELDECLGAGDDGNPFDDDDLEGEEWKHGLQPGERPPEPPWMEESRREQEEQERQYDEPDRRPRELNWTDREDRHQPRRDVGGGSGGAWTEDDIPF
jgi:hypothetical protein